MKIKIKPHHLLDLICDMGANNGAFDYISPYGHGMRKYGNLLAQGEIDALSFTFGADDICSPCIKLKDGICTDIFNEEIAARYGMDKKYDYNMILDTGFIKALPEIFTPDKELSIDEVYSLLKEKLTEKIILLNWPRDNRVELTYKGLEMAIAVRNNK